MHQRAAWGVLQTMAGDYPAKLIPISVKVAAPSPPAGCQRRARQAIKEITVFKTMQALSSLTAVW